MQILLVEDSLADIELTLDALAGGAQEYLVKGEHDGPRIATAVLHALQRHRAEQQTRQYLQLARGLLDALEAPSCALSAIGDISAVNGAWRAFMTHNGGDPDACGEGSNYLRICDAVADDSAESATAAAVGQGLRSVLDGRLARYQHEYPCHGPQVERWFSVRISPTDIDGTRGAVVSHVDITELHSVQQALSHQALHDHLTGLPNRMLLNDRLSQALSDSARRGCLVGVAFVDLDHFKRINDSLGHPAGDAILAQVAERFSALLRATDTLSRFAGDEFVVVWRELASAEDVTLLSERLVSALDEPFNVGTTSVVVSASVGVAVGTLPQTVEEMLQAADAAMYDAKHRGRGRVRVYSNELRQGAEDRMATEVALRSALARSELVLHYQPVIDLTTGEAIAIEALARWQHPERGLLAPYHFIPVAESSGLVVPLGAWALRQACGDTAALTGIGRDLDVAVNLSVRQLTQSDVVKHVRDALALSGLAPRRLILEVTESAVMEDEAGAAAAIKALSGLGVRIAIDDFGTGYSSMLHLRRYAIDVLKLDREFVSGIGVSQADEAICSSVVSLAGAVGATSIAEGVETEQQYATLKMLGCQQAQGFLWSPAVPIDALERALVTCSEVPMPRAAAVG
jgi:diguanylate cyclase (GGDEF)-like protein